MVKLAASQALANLFEPQLDDSSFCNEPDCPGDENLEFRYPLRGQRSYGDLRARRPRALTVSSASSTTFLDKTYRGRFPCGRYHRNHIVQATLRSSFSTSPCSSGTTTHSSPHAVINETPFDAPIPDQADSQTKLGGLRRLFGLSRKQDATEKRKPLLRPLVLPKTTKANTVNRARGTSERIPDKLARRLSLQISNWLPPATKQLVSIAATAAQSSLSQTRQRSQLRPLVLVPSRQSALGDTPPLESPPSNVTSVILWLLECIQKDTRPSWADETFTSTPVDQRMLLQDGRARCLAVRAKRRSALF
ncbi:hypothetical protein BKA70DRAFT_311230 [Coprinopsis sp. MPI-PUGE-AT-0042]|nr:hypothetical protein BKA70DRAFT_311230 [Coprinopsis sp. MPI-PUGE-AT-0042]